MLSRVAERTYWIGRYMERAENLARLCNVFGKLFLDLPSSAGLGWVELTRITGAGDTQPQPESRADRERIIDYLLADSANPGSLLSSLSMARENARTTRDILPTEAWLAVNKLYLDMRERSTRVRSRRDRHRALAEIVSACQTFSGLIANTMSHNEAFAFIELGVHVERADMTSRTLDTAVALLLSNREELAAYDNTLWMAVLKSVSGYQMYRQSVRRRVQGTDVIRFLFTDTQFPRSISYCLNTAGTMLTRLPEPQAVVDVLHPASRQLTTPTAELSAAELHTFIDELQISIGAVHDAIDRRWFRPDTGE